MVPLDRVLRQRGADAVAEFVLPELKPPAPAPIQAPKPLEFKVVDVMTRQVLAEHANTRATVQALAEVHSIVDVTIYVWERERERWRRLTFSEARALWNYRGQGDSPVAELAE